MMLPSWRAGPARDAVLEFVEAAAQLPPEDRVAVFDNDGTLWCERPMYPQLHFLVDALRRAAQDEPSLTTRPEYGAILSGDRKAVTEIGLVRIATALVELFAGVEPEDFEKAVRSFFETSTHPERGVPYRSMVYRPMLELLDELRVAGFTPYVVTAGGAEFVRAIGRDFYGVSPAQVVGSQLVYRVSMVDEAPSLIRTGQIFDRPNEGLDKIAHLQRQIGQRPILAAGNSPGDAEMLAYVSEQEGPSLSLIVDHDDADREYAYRSRAGTFEAEKSIADTAQRLGWVVISMRNDWSTVFGE